MNKGNISVTAVIGWGITIAVVSMGFTYGQIGKVQDAQAKASESQADLTERVAVTETKGDQYKDDISEINRKLDILINQKNGKSN